MSGVYYGRHVVGLLACLIGMYINDQSLTGPRVCVDDQLPETAPLLLFHLGGYHSRLKQKGEEGRKTMKKNKHRVLLPVAQESMLPYVGHLCSVHNQDSLAPTPLPLPLSPAIGPSISRTVLT